MLGCMCEHNTQRGSGLHGLGDDTGTISFPQYENVDTTIYGGGQQIDWPTIPSTSGVGLSMWNNILQQGFQTGFSLTKDILGTHPTLQTTGPNGQSTTYYAPVGANATGLNVPGFATGSLSTIDIVLGLGAVVLLFAMMGRH